METMERVTLSLKKDVVAEIDRERGLVKRSTFINDLLLNLLEKRKAAS
jgi:metal-responsive CopG/Arc/MetJ family transcriptional regulator